MKPETNPILTVTEVIPVYCLDWPARYRLWVGRGGVFLVAASEAALVQARAEVTGRLPTIKVQETMHTSKEALLVQAASGRELTSAEVEHILKVLSEKPDPVKPGPERSVSSRRTAEVRRVRLKDVPATFYVGPAGVLVVSEFYLVADTEARKVWENSGGRLPVLPAVIGQGMAGSVRVFKDEEELKAYLRGGEKLDSREVRAVAGWLRNQSLPLPEIQEKEGRYHLGADEVIGAKEEIPQGPVVQRYDFVVTFYVGPAGIVIVSETGLIADSEARMVWEMSGRTLSALPVVIGRVSTGSVRTFADQKAVTEYLRGAEKLDEREIRGVAGWLKRRDSPVPKIRKKWRPLWPNRARVTGREHRPGRRWRLPGLKRVLFYGVLTLFSIEIAGVLLAAVLTTFFFPVRAWEDGSDVIAVFIMITPLLLRFVAFLGYSKRDFLRWRGFVLLGVGALEVYLGWTMQDQLGWFLMLVGSSSIAWWLLGLMPERKSHSLTVSNTSGIYQ